jgi:hypothetical protein
MLFREHGRLRAMKKELNSRELFDSVASGGEIFDHEWEDAVDELVTRQGRLVGLREPDDRSSEAGAGVIHVYRLRGVYVAYDDDGAFGPFKTFDEAAESVSLRRSADTGTRVWIAEDR